MNCNEIQPNLMDYSLGRLTPSETEDIERHLAACGECRTVLEEEREFHTDLNCLPLASPANDVWALIRSQAKPHLSVLSMMRSKVAKLSAAVAVSAAIVLTVVFTQPGLQKNKIDKESVHAVAATMMQPERTMDDPLGSNSDALVAVIDEGT